MSRERPAGRRWRLWLAVAAVLLTGGIGYWIGLERVRSNRLAEGLIRDTRRLAEARYLRETHVRRPLRGTFGAALEAIYPKLVELQQRQQAVGKAPLKLARAVAHGVRSLSELDPEIAKLVVSHRASLEALRRTTHTVAAGPPQGLGALADPAHALAKGGWLPVIASARLLALASYRHLERGEPAVALAICVDALALARDVSLGTGLLGRMVGAALQRMLVPSCGAAIDAAPAAARARTLAQLEGIARASAPFGPVIDQESVVAQLLAFAPLLGEEHLSRLPDQARAMVASRAEHSGDGSSGLVGQVGRSMLSWHAWERYVAMMARVRAAVELPPSQVLGRLERILAEVRRSSINPMVEVMGGVSYNKYWLQHRRAGLELGLLGAAILVEDYRASRGAWPDSVATVRGELARRGMSFDAALRIKRLSDGRLRLKLSTREPSEVVLSP